MTDGIMLTGEDCLMRTEDQRLLVQSLLLDPPQTAEDERLVLLQRRQTILWLEKIEGCAAMQLCISLPDRPVDAFLPRTQAEIERAVRALAERSYEQLLDTEQLAIGWGDI